MTFPWNAIAGKDRVLFKTYESIPGIQTLAVSYAGQNSGYFGYLGGINYIDINPSGGGYSVQLRNLWATNYGTVAANSGIFDFDYNTIQNIQASVVIPVGSLASAAGKIVTSYDFSSGILNFAYVVSGAVAALPANSTVHFQISFSRINGTLAGSEF